MQAHPHFLLLAQYNLWATKRLLDAVVALPEHDYRRDMGLFFKSIDGTLNHLLVGEHLIWYPRLAQGISPQLKLDMQAQTDRLRLAQELTSGAARWQPLIASWLPERFAENLTYTTTRGQIVTLPLAAILTHVFNHGTHHRGQITAALTTLGLACPVLDLIYFLQEQAPS